MVSQLGPPLVGERILLGSVGDSVSMERVNAHLTSCGWGVEPFDPIPGSVDRGPGDAIPATDTAVVAIIVVAPIGNGLDPLDVIRLVHVMGVLRGQLGMGRVVMVVDQVLVNHPVGEELAATGIRQISYRSGHIDARLPQLDLVIGACRQDAAVSSEHGFGIGASQRPLLESQSGILAAMMVVAALILVVAAGPAVRSLVATWSPVTGNDGAAGGGPGRSASTQGRIYSVASSESSLAGRSGEVGSLPITCHVDMTVSLAVKGAITCEQGTTLVVQGHLGPWVGRVESFNPEPGVVGRQAAIRNSAPRSSFGDANPGVDGLELQFAAVGQSVRLRSGTIGGRETVLTLTQGRSQP